jgi:hypothetical protein
MELPHNDVEENIESPEFQDHTWNHEKNRLMPWMNSMAFQRVILALLDVLISDDERGSFLDPGADLHLSKTLSSTASIAAQMSRTRQFLFVLIIRMAQIMTRTFLNSYRYSGK